MVTILYYETKKALYFSIGESNILDAYIHHGQIYVEYVNDLAGFHQNLHVIWSCLTIYFVFSEYETINKQTSMRFLFQANSEFSGFPCASHGGISAPGYYHLLVWMKIWNPLPHTAFQYHLQTVPQSTSTNKTTGIFSALQLLQRCFLECLKRFILIHTFSSAIFIIFPILKKLLIFFRKNSI